MTCNYDKFEILSKIRVSLFFFIYFLLWLTSGVIRPLHGVLTIICIILANRALADDIFVVLPTIVVRWTMPIVSWSYDRCVYWRFMDNKKIRNLPSICTLYTLPCILYLSIKYFTIDHNTSINNHFILHLVFDPMTRRADV